MVVETKKLKFNKDDTIPDFFTDKFYNEKIRIANNDLITSVNLWFCNIESAFKKIKKEDTLDCIISILSRKKIKNCFYDMQNQVDNLLKLIKDSDFIFDDGTVKIEISDFDSLDKNINILGYIEESLQVNDKFFNEEMSPDGFKKRIISFILVENGKLNLENIFLDIMSFAEHGIYNSFLRIWGNIETLIKIKRFLILKNDLKLSQTEIGKSISMTQGSISAITKGKVEIDLSHALLLKAVYNLNPEWLLHGTEPMYLSLSTPVYQDTRQKEVNQAYEFVREPAREEIHEVAKKLYQEEKNRQKEQEEYEKQHQADVKKMLENRIPVAEMIDIPILGNVSAGIPRWSHESIEGYLSWDKSRISSIENVFWLRIDGTSMIGCGMYPDDAILCDIGITPRKGDAVVAKVGDDITVKQYRRVMKGDQSFIELVPCNEEYETVSFPEDQVKIIAVVIANDWRLKRGEEKTWRR